MFESFLKKYVLDNGVTTAIETGTNQASTTRILALHFNRVISIELSEQLFSSAESMDFHHRKNVEFIHGDSRDYVY